MMDQPLDLPFRTPNDHSTGLGKASSNFHRTGDAKEQFKFSIKVRVVLDHSYATPEIHLPKDNWTFENVCETVSMIHAPQTEDTFQATERLGGDKYILLQQVSQTRGDKYRPFRVIAWDCPDAFDDWKETLKITGTTTACMEIHFGQVNQPFHLLEEIWKDDDLQTWTKQEASVIDEEPPIWWDCDTPTVGREMDLAEWLEHEMEMALPQPSSYEFFPVRALTK